MPATIITPRPPKTPGEISRLLLSLSLSEEEGGDLSSTFPETPHPSDPWYTTHQPFDPSTPSYPNPKKDLDDYLNTRTFQTPLKPAPSTPMTMMKQPPRSTSKGILVDRSNTHDETPKKQTKRDPTPSKPKASTLTPSHHRETLPVDSLHFLSPAPHNRSSMIVEVSSEEEEDEVISQTAHRSEQGSCSTTSTLVLHERPRTPKDRHTSTSTSAQRLDPEAAHLTSKDEQSSILLGTAFAEEDLRERNYQGVMDLTQEIDEDEENVGPERMEVTTTTPFRPKYSDQSNLYDRVGAPSPKLSPIEFPETPVAVTTVRNRLSSPGTPRDAKEWLKMAAATLEEARAERNAARQWAHDMKEAVQNWVQQQRQLVHKETLNRLEEVLEEHQRQWRLEQNRSMAKVQSMMEDLQSELGSFQRPTSSTQESQWQQLLEEQQERIQKMSKQLWTIQNTLQQQQQKQQSLSSPVANQRETGSRPPQPPPLTTTQQGPSATKSFRSSMSPRTKTPLPNGGHVIKYSNGVIKEVHPDNSVVVRFPNGDVETRLGDGKVAYYYSKDQVLQITDPHPATSAQPSVVWEYPNGQVERHYADGSKLVVFPNGTKQRVLADGTLEP